MTSRKLTADEEAHYRSLSTFNLILEQFCEEDEELADAIWELMERMDREGHEYQNQYFISHSGDDFSLW